MFNLSGSMPVLPRRSLFLGSLAAAAIGVSSGWGTPAANAALPSSGRVVEEPQPSLGNRHRVAPCPLVFAEVQYKYSLFQNYLGEFDDRPLYFDRSLRPDSTAFTTAESYLREVGIAQGYGLDGLGSLAVPSLSFYQQVIGWLAATPDRAAGHHEFPEFAFGWLPAFSPTNPTYLQARQVLRLALGSSFTPRVEGRIPIATYNSGYVAFPVMRQFLDALRDEFGDTFAVMGQLVIDWDDMVAWGAARTWPTDVVAKYRDRIAELLDVFDGIQIEMPTKGDSLDYRGEPVFDLFDQVISPMVVAALALPGNEAKLLCGQVRPGYANQFTMLVEGDYGTRRLRNTLDRLVALNPDLVFFFEWNEFNENTCVAPTLRNGRALQRIIKYYCSLLRGVAAAPLDGDDLATPQLVLSHRHEVKVGEVIDVELLNVPDTTASETYVAQLRVHDAAGELLCVVGTETFDRSVLRAVTFTLRSERFSTETVLCPQLRLTGRHGEVLLRDLEHIRIQPTVSRNYTVVRQSIRDVLPVTEAVLDASVDIHGRLTLTGHLAAGEELATVEILDHGKEIYAVDPTDEYQLADSIVLTASPQSRTSRYEPFQLSVTGAPGWRFFPKNRQQFPTITTADGVVSGQVYVWVNRSRWHVTVPRALAPDAELSLTLGGETQSFRVADLLDDGRVGQLYAQGTTKDARVDWEVLRHQPDVPPNLGVRSVSWSVDLPAATDHPILQLRAVSTSGKIHRSKPVLPRPAPAATQPLPVISESTGALVRPSVVSALLPRIAYRFDVRSVGAVLLSDAGREYDGQLGGGLWYEDPFYHPAIPLTPGFSKAPRLATIDGRPALEFSDEQSWVNFPIETFPRGAFTVTMTIKPSLTGNYVLLRHFSLILGSVTIHVDSAGELTLGFGDRHLNPVTHVFASGLKVSRDEWHHVTVGFDCSTMIFGVDGATASRPVQAPLLALYAKPLVFGGHVKAEFGLPPGVQYFRGHLAELVIDHAAPGSRPS